jgi:type IV pilus assembly protein PilC
VGLKDIVLFSRVTNKEKFFFCRQLSVMISGGIPLDNAINLVRSQTKNVAFKNILEQVYKDLERGEALSGALAKYPRVFDDVFIAIVSSGEATGKLEKVLDNLAVRMETTNDFQSKVKSALAYPVFIVIAMIGVIVLMMLKIVPILKTVFEDAGLQLPWTTRLIIAVSDFTVTYWWAILIVVIGLVASGWIFFTQTRTGRFTWDWLKLKTPLVNFVASDMYMARFCRSLGMLISAGVPIIETLKITARSLNNRIYVRIIKNVISQVERGVPISVPLEKAKEFPPLVPQMIMVGEQTGKLELLMDKTADYYEREIDNKIKTITNLIEPVTIVIVGFGVGFLVYSILYPIYGLVQVF